MWLISFSKFKTQLRSFEDTDKYHQNSKDHNVMKLTNSFSKMSNEVSCFKCDGKGHVAKICPNNFKKKKKWCNYCKTHVRESCRYKKRDTIKATEEEEEDSSFVFKINDRPQRTVESKRIMVDTGAPSHIIKDIERVKDFNDSFQPDNHFIELADGTKTNGIALTRGDAEICLVNANRNMESITLKGALFIPSYPQDIFSVKSATGNGVAITFKKNKNVWGLKGFLGSQWLRARLCCRKISDSIFWLYYFTPRWLAGAMPCPKKVQKKYTKRKDRNRQETKTFLPYFPLFTWWMD